MMVIQGIDMALYCLSSILVMESGDVILSMSLGWCVPLGPFVLCSLHDYLDMY
jgi:hypothetical protein